MGWITTCIYNVEFYINDSQHDNKTVTKHEKNKCLASTKKPEDRTHGTLVPR